MLPTEEGFFYAGDRIIDGSTMDTDTLQRELSERGELMVNVEEFEVPLELHLHDTEIRDEDIVLELADGTLTFAIESITGYWNHYHSLADYDLD